MDYASFASLHVCFYVYLFANFNMGIFRDKYILWHIYYTSYSIVIVKVKVVIA